jgi:hypothetical protein
MFRDFITRFYYINNKADLIGGIFSLLFVLSLLISNNYLHFNFSVSQVFFIIIISLFIQLLGLILKLKKFSYNLRITKKIQFPKISGFSNWSILTSKNILITNTLALYTPTTLAANIYFFFNFFGPIRQLIPLGINLFGHNKISKKFDTLLSLILKIVIIILIVILILDRSNYLIHGLFLVICDFFFIYSTFKLFKIAKLDNKVFVMFLLIPLIITYIIIHFIFANNFYALYFAELSLFLMSVFINFKGAND